MKIISFTLMLVCTTLYAGAQGTWTTKQALFNGCYTQSNAHFAIGNKAYIGMGPDFCFDWWEYNPVTDAYTQKASFPDTTMSNAAVFTLSGYGYVISQGNRLWKYDPVTDSWNNTGADFPGVRRLAAYYFSIGDKGYVGGGMDVNGPLLQDLWEYNSATNQWAQRADMPQANAIGEGFTLNGKGYITGGVVNTGNCVFTRKVYSYDPDTDVWTMKADLPDGRYAGSSFVSGNHAYIGMGIVSDTAGNLDDPFTKVWKYDDVADSWSKAADIPFQYIYDEGVGFAINGKGYFGLGDCNGNPDANCGGGLQRKIFEYSTGAAGVAAASGAGIIVYPNPSSGKFTFSIGNVQQGRLTICNMLGETVCAALIDAEHATVDLGEQPAGVYFYKIDFPNGSSLNGKVLKE